VASRLPSLKNVSGRQRIAFLASTLKREISCAAISLIYYLWGSPDCVLPDASGKFFAHF
jgi:hypothetical protein